MVDERARPELADRQEPRPGQVVTLSAAAGRAGRDERRDRQPGEGVAGQKAFGGEVPVAVEVAVADVVGLVAQQVQLRRGLQVLGAGVADRLGRGRRITQDPVGDGHLGAGRPERLPPPVTRPVQLAHRGVDGAPQPVLVIPGRLRHLRGRVQHPPGPGQRPPGRGRVGQPLADRRVQRETGLLAGHIEQVDQRAAQRLAGLSQPDRVHVGADQVGVGQVQPGRGDRAGDHPGRAVEVVLVVRATGRAVRDHDRRLPPPPGPPGPLRVVGRGRRDVPQHHRVQGGDVHPQLHRRGAEQRLQPGLAERLLPFLPHRSRHLRGVLGRPQPGQPGRQRPVEPHEVRVRGGPGVPGRAAHRIRGPLGPVPGQPAQRRRVELIRPDPVLVLDREHQPVVGQRDQHPCDRRPGVGGGHWCSGVPADLTAQELAVGRQPGQEQVPPVVGRPPRPGPQPAGQVAFLLGDRPRVAQVLLGQRPDRLEPVRAQRPDPDRQRPAHLVQQHPQQPLPLHRRQLAQAAGLPPGSVVDDFVQGGVVDAQQPGVFQVRPVGHRLPQCPLGLLPRQRALHRRRDRVLLPGQPERADHRPGQRVMAQPARPGRRRCPVQSAAHQPDLHEIVEVPGLQGGVLPVVGERQHLAGLLGQILLPPQGSNQAGGQHRRGRAAAFRAEAGQLREVLLPRRLIRHPAAQAEPQRRRHIRRRHPHLPVPVGGPPPVGQHHHRLR